MNAIKVTKAGLKQETEKILTTISAEVKQMGEAYAFFPQPGKLLQFLSILKDNNLHYTFTNKVD
jgi:hypothetical protein